MITLKQSAQTISVSPCLELNEWDWTMKEQTSINYMIMYTLKLKIIMKFFFTKQYFFLNYNPDI